MKRQERIKLEQNETIIKQCKILGIDPNSKFIKQFIGEFNYDLEYQKIKSLQLEIERKTQIINELQTKISDYVKKSNHYDERLGKIDNEKAKLFDEFQIIGTEEKTMSFSELNTSEDNTKLISTLRKKDERISELKHRIQSTKKLIEKHESDNEVLRNALSVSK